MSLFFKTCKSCVSIWFDWGKSCLLFKSNCKRAVEKKLFINFKGKMNDKKISSKITLFVFSCVYKCSVCWTNPNVIKNDIKLWKSDKVNTILPIYTLTRETCHKSMKTTWLNCSKMPLDYWFWMEFVLNGMYFNGSNLLQSWKKNNFRAEKKRKCKKPIPLFSYANTLEHPPTWNYINITRA